MKKVIKEADEQICAEFERSLDCLSDKHLVRLYNSFSSGPVSNLQEVFLDMAVSLDMEVKKRGLNK